MGKDTISGVIPGSGADGALGPDPRISDGDQSQASDRNEFANVCFWHKADISKLSSNLRYCGGKADTAASRYVYLQNGIVTSIQASGTLRQ